MSINPVLAGIAAVVALVSAQSVSAQNRPAAPAGQVPAANPTAPAIAEPADRLLKEMGVYIGSSEQFTFHANITFDHVLPSGQKLRFSAAQEVALQRPGRLYVEWNSDLGARQFWYDGKSITVYDPATPFYAREAAPPRPPLHPCASQVGRCHSGVRSSDTQGGRKALPSGSPS